MIRTRAAAAALVGLLAACGRGGERARVEPGSGSSAAPAITAQLVGCHPALPAPEDPRDPVGAAVGIATPRVVVDVGAVAGDLDAAVVRRLLRREVARYAACFTQRVAVDPAVAGGVVEVAFAIQPAGSVASPHADGVDPQVARCVASAVAAVAFPAPRDGNQVQVTARIRIEHRADPFARRRAARVPREWTPFAAEAAGPAEGAAALVAAVTTHARSRLAAIEHCFDGARGAVRAMIAIRANGGVETTRAGGLGDSAIEQCIGLALGGLAIAPPLRPVEIACDFARGGEAPLRVSPDAGYTVIEVTARELRTRTSVREIPPRGTRPVVTSLGATSSVLIVAEPDAPAHGLAAALWWAPAGTTLVAVKASGGAPVFLGMGDGRAERAAATDRRVVELRTDGGRLRACVGGEPLAASAPLLDPRAMDGVLAAVVAACAREACEPTVVVGTRGEFVAKDLVATTSAARRAGFARLSIGGPACD